MELEYFRMIDRVAALDLDGGTIRCEADVPDRSPVFEGHFPGYPLLPGALMVETIAQASGWLLLAASAFSQMPFLARVVGARMRREVRPGQRLAVSATLLHQGAGYAGAEGRIELDGDPVAEAELRFRTIPFPDKGFRDVIMEQARRLGIDPDQYLEAGAGA